MKSTKSSQGFGIILIAAYALYAMFSLGFATMLMSFAFGLIFYGFKESIEMTAAVIIVSGIILKYVMRRGGAAAMEGFEDASGAEQAQTQQAPETGSTEAKGSEAKKDGFADINPAPVEAGFKLGDIPKDEKGGFFIDQGTTLMNALNGLKPEQINAMTNDTKQLIDTQKSLMGMLNTLAPMMKEGSNLLTMFNGMFGQKV